MSLPLDLTPLKTATISPDGLYRYDLTRHWAESRPVVWVMLNPSTADADVDDPTIRRCIAFTKSWGLGSLAVVNLYALRATDPKELLTADDPRGPENFNYLRLWIDRAEFVVAAWGASAQPRRWRPSIETVTKGLGKRLFCLGTTKDGHPRHPLYVKGDTELVPFGYQEAAT